MSRRNGRRRTQHWADLVRAEFAPSREQIIADRLQQIEDTPDLEIVDLILKAKGKPPQLPKPERIEAERHRLEGMTVDELLAERAAEEEAVRLAIREAKARSEATLRAWRESGEPLEAYFSDPGRNSR